MLIYADTSAFAKLWIKEAHSDFTRQVLQGSGNIIACSAIGKVEIVSALRRAYKAGRISGTRFAKIHRELEEKWKDVVVMATVPEVISTAERYAIKFALRGYDAVHLASLLHLTQSGVAPVLASFDDELIDAAEKSGIHVLYPR